MEQNLYAFWEYDRFPYVLGGKVNEILPSGNVTAGGFDGMTFKPIVILPHESGMKIKNQLERLKTKHTMALRDLNSDYYRKVEAIFPVSLRKE